MEGKYHDTTHAYQFKKKLPLKAHKFYVTGKRIVTMNTQLCLP